MAIRVRRFVFWLALAAVIMSGALLADARTGADTEPGEATFSPAVDPPPALERVGHLGGLFGKLLVNGSYVYLVSGSEMAVLDVSDPANPRLTTRVSPWGFPNDMTLVGNYIYVSGVFCDPICFSGLLILDVSNPAYPVAAGEYPVPGITGLAVSGSLLYALRGSATGYCTFLGGWVALDISEPLSPVEIGEWDEGYPEKRMVVRGQYGYVLDDGESSCSGWLNSLFVYDLTDPIHPQLLWADYTGSGKELAISGNYLYVVYSGLDVWNLSDPAAPVYEVTVHTEGDSQGVAIEGNYAYVTNASEWSFGQFYEGSLQVIDVISPTQPTTVAYYPIECGGMGVAAVGSAVYASGSWEGLFVIDAADPENPQTLGIYHAPGELTHVAADGREAYAANIFVTPQMSLMAVDASNSRMPFVEGFFDPPPEPVYPPDAPPYRLPDDLPRGRTGLEAQPPNGEDFLVPSDTDDLWALAAQDGYVYVTDDPNVLIVDARNPLSMTEVAKIPLFVRQAVVAGHYLYLPNGLHIYDVSDPANPVLTGYCDCGGGSRVAVAGQYAYLLSSTGLYVIDISDPANPVESGHVSWGSAHSEYGVAVSNGYAFLVIANGNAELLKVNVTDPANPILEEPVTLSGGANDVVASGDYVFAVGYWGLDVLDASDPAQPYLMTSYVPPYSPIRVAVEDGYVYLATYLDGLYIFRFNPLLHEVFLPVVGR